MMGAKKSAEMREAQRLLQLGKSAAEASRLAGVTKGAISQNAECRKIIEDNKNAKAAEKTD